MEVLQNKTLYGQALTVSLPSSFRSIEQTQNNFRDLVPVPDNQEVWVSEHKEITLVFELVEKQEAWKHEDATANHFKDLAQANSSQENTILKDEELKTQEMPSLSQEISYIGYLEGEQLIIPGKKDGIEPERVAILLLLIRYKSLDTEMLINITIPWKKEQYDQNQWDSLIQEGRALMGHIKASLNDSKLSTIL